MFISRRLFKFAWLVGPIFFFVAHNHRHHLFAPFLEHNPTPSAFILSLSVFFLHPLVILLPSLPSPIQFNPSLPSILSTFLSVSSSPYSEPNSNTVLLSGLLQLPSLLLSADNE